MRALLLRPGQPGGHRGSAERRARALILSLFGHQLATMASDGPRDEAVSGRRDCGERAGSGRSRAFQAQLLAERGQDPGARGTGAAVDERSAARAIEPGDLLVEGAVPDAERLGGGGDAGVTGDDQQVVQASACAGSDEGAAEWFGQVARVEAGCRAGRHAAAGAATADLDAVVAGEPVEGLQRAADLGGDVVQGPVPGEVFRRSQAGSR